VGRTKVDVDGVVIQIGAVYLVALSRLAIENGTTPCCSLLLGCRQSIPNASKIKRSRGTIEDRGGGGEGTNEGRERERKRERKEEIGKRRTEKKCIAFFSALHLFHLV